MIKRFFLTFFIIIIALSLGELVISNSLLQVVHNSFFSDKVKNNKAEIDKTESGNVDGSKDTNSNVKNGIRIVQLSDLHERSFGTDNTNLVSEVKEQNPDVILMTGDTVTASSKEYSAAVNAIKGLSKIAPVYISKGNHEEMYENSYNIDIGQIFEAAGAVYLDDQYEDIEINGHKVRIGGVYGLCYPPSKSEKADASFLQSFQKTDSLKILLAHLPVVWKDTDNLDYWDIDFVFSGHLHGGQVRLPLVGAVYAPDQGWFPGKISGVFKAKSAERYLILSAGLGNNNWIPRFCNRPEIRVVDIVPK